jgi:hypothetical protein
MTDRLRKSGQSCISIEYTPELFVEARKVAFSVPELLRHNLESCFSFYRTELASVDANDGREVENYHEKEYSIVSFHISRDLLNREVLKHSAQLGTSLVYHFVPVSNGRGCIRRTCDLNRIQNRRRRVNGLGQNNVTNQLRFALGFDFSFLRSSDLSLDCEPRYYCAEQSSKTAKDTSGEPKPVRSRAVFCRVDREGDPSRQSEKRDANTGAKRRYCDRRENVPLPHFGTLPCALRFVERVAA